MCCLALCISLLLAACGREEGTSGGAGNKQEDAGAGNVSGAASELEWAYVPEVITVGDEYADYGRMQPVGESFCYVSQRGDFAEGAKTICRYSLSDQKLERVPIGWPEGGGNWDVSVWSFAQDGSLYLIANVYPKDYSRLNRYLCRFDREGNCLFSEDITERLGKDDSPDRLTVDGQGRLYVFTDSGEILLYNGDGEYHGAVGCNPSGDRAEIQVKGACDGADGKYYICFCRENTNVPGGEKRYTLAEIDFAGAALQEVAADLPGLSGFCAGTRDGNGAVGEGGVPAEQGENRAVGEAGNPAEQGENRIRGAQYDFLMYDDRAVYGYNLAGARGSGSLGEELFVWMDSDINGYYVTNLYLQADGRIYATVEDWDNEDRSIVALAEVKADQAPRRETLTLATVGGESRLAAMAVKFNRGNSQYHLDVKSYESLTDLYNAVLTRKPVDLVDLSGIDVQKLASRGFFEDLMPYVNRSELFDSTDFVDGILKVYTFDGKLTGIPASFTLRTVVGNGSQPENKAGLTLDGLIASGDRYPGAKAFDGITREEMMQYIMMFNEDTFIDWETGVCKFESESFRRVLEYVSRFPDSPESGKEELSLPAKIKSGEVLYAIAELDELKALQVYQGMFGEDASCIGFPTPEGQGGHILFTDDAYAIASLSEHKEGAWKFIEGFLSQEKNESYYMSDSFFSVSFPTLKRLLNQKVEAVIASDGQTDSKKFPELIYEDGTTFQYHALTWEDVNTMLRLIPEAKPYAAAEGNEIIRIINEEASGYYSGQKGAEDVAKVIQNRVQLYVNEAYQN
ncbi:MAG: hypothetical protein NC432_02665 [Roseburia sp.]|nr:hypothetical protein [Roseburia sp.]MCM1097136.1 hypothetical protein [Ruminococcus flavefaciens]